MLSPRELTAAITVLTEMGDTNHSMGRLMRGEREREWEVMDRWMDGRRYINNIKEDEGRERRVLFWGWRHGERCVGLRQRARTEKERRKEDR